jgi:hypothetical protein
MTTETRPTLADELDRLAREPGTPIAAVLAMGHAAIVLRNQQDRIDALEAERATLQGQLGESELYDRIRAALKGTP